jgi:hypothetical protein
MEKGEEGEVKEEGENTDTEWKDRGEEKRKGERRAWIRRKKERGEDR